MPLSSGNNAGFQCNQSVHYTTLQWSVTHGHTLFKLLIMIRYCISLIILRIYSDYVYSDFIIGTVILIYILFLWAQTSEWTYIAAEAVGCGCGLTGFLTGTKEVLIQRYANKSFSIHHSKTVRFNYWWSAFYLDLYTLKHKLKTPLMTLYYYRSP